MPVIDAEVICQFDKEGNIIPLKIRIEDETHMRQTFAVKQYKPPKTTLKTELSYLGGIPRQTPDILDYECKIEVVGMMRTLTLRYFVIQKRWKIIC